jgi:hypothetical protein
LDDDLRGEIEVMLAATADMSSEDISAVQKEAQSLSSADMVARVTSQ